MLGNSYIIVSYNSTSDVFKCVKVKELSSSTGWLVGMYSGVIIVESRVLISHCMLSGFLSMFFS